MKDDLSFGIVLQRLDTEELKFPIFIPNKPVVGKLNKEDNVLIDVCTGLKYACLNYLVSDRIDEAVALITPLTKLKTDMASKNMYDAIKKFWLGIENMVLFFNKDKVISSMYLEDFEDAYKVTLDVKSTEELNEITDKMINGSNEELEDYNYKYEEPNYKVTGSIKEKYETIRKKIINQDEAIKKLLVSIYKSRFISNSPLKSNILLYGPTGVGKTELVRSLGSVFNIPVLEEDATRYTDTGYVGGSVDDILINLYLNANKNIDLAEHSILFIDEIDKKATNISDKSFNKTDVLNDLLRIIEGGVFEVKIDKKIVSETIKFDTSKLIIILGGAFTDLYKVENKIGFKPTDTFKNKVVEEPNNEITLSSFSHYGLPKEFIGRIRTYIPLNSLSEKDLYDILTKSEISVLKSYKDFFKSLGVELDISDEATKLIAKEGYKYGIGARGLNKVCDELFESIIYNQIDDISELEKIEITEDTILNNDNYKLIKKM